MKIKLPDFTKPDNRKKFFIITGGVIFLTLFGMLVSGIPFATNPTLCGKICHSTSFEYKTWQESSHAEVPCHYCHSDKSYVGLYKEKFFQTIRRSYLTLTNSADLPLNADSSYARKVENNRCLRCHSPENREFTVQLGLKVDSKMHLKHVKLNIKCTDCHNRVAHHGKGPIIQQEKTKNGFKYKNFMRMGDGCLRCHGSDDSKIDKALLASVKPKVPPKKCSTCHTSTMKLKPHKKGDEDDHNDVNGIPWRNGKKRHGKVAVKDFDACQECHPRKRSDNLKFAADIPNCTDSCHKNVTMPHNIPKWSNYFKKNDPKWLKNHPSTAKKVGSDACLVCHKSASSDKKAFCNECHHKRFYKEMPSLSRSWTAKEGGMKYVRDKGSYLCWRCHKPDFCTACHTKG